MASFTFNSLQQNHHHLFSVTLFNGNVSQRVAKLSTTDHEPCTETKISKTKKETSPGFPTLSSKHEKASKNYLKRYVSSVEEEKTENRFTKDRNSRKNMGFGKRREMSNGHSSMKSRVKNSVAKSLESMEIVNDKTDKKAKKGSGKQVGEEKKDKGSKKNKVDSPELQMRIGLDMCSKKGDVMGAIQVYDLAQKEGIQMGQYHYTVLLYLCSSAAVGVVRPAKSGSGTRTLDTLDSPNEVSMVKSTDLGKSEHLVNKNWGDREANISGSDNGHLNATGKSHGTSANIELTSRTRSVDDNSTFNEKERLTWFSNGVVKRNSRLLNGLSYPRKYDEESSHIEDGSKNQEDDKIVVGEDVKKYALQKGFEIYEKMCADKIPMNEAALTSVARMAMSMGNGDMAFDMVKQMKSMGINPRLRSYGPALSAFCNSGDIDKAFAVEKHMLEHGVYPEEPELEALLRVSVGVGKGDKVYYLLHKLRTLVRKVSPSTANLIVSWFESKAASRVGKTKWDQGLIKEAIVNGGGGWHGQGWLGRGKWSVLRTTIGADGFCKCCGEKLATIDLDPKETENFAESVASIAIKREKNSSFQKFQKWLDYYGPFEAVVDAANVGLFSQKRFMPSKIKAIVNGIRQKFPSRKWPLIILHNRRITGRKMDEPINRALIDKWRNADALYATPTGSNDDWYWLYAAIKFKCLLVTNDEMRDHIFQLLGNDFFPKWKERHQVHFSFSDAGPVFHMPPPCSVVIQESEKGHWHIPILSEHDYEAERPWLCITRAKSRIMRQNSETGAEDLQFLHHHNGFAKSETKIESTTSQPLNNVKHENSKHQPQETYKNLRDIMLGSMMSDHHSILPEIETAEQIGGCTIDFQI